MLCSVQISDVLVHGGLALDILGFIVRVAALLIVPVNRRPSSAMAWLLAIFLVPYAGVVAFLLIGNPKLPRHRREKQRQVNDLIDEAARDAPNVTPQGEDWLGAIARLNRNLGALPMVSGNSATLNGDYDDTVRQLTAAVEGATESVLCEFYILALDEVTEPFFAALDAAVARGVRVHVLYDHIGSRRVKGYRRMVARLRSSGVQWRPMLPVMPLRGKYQRPDLRNHRKILVVDQAVCFLGSLNLIERGYHKKARRRGRLQWQENW